MEIFTLIAELGAPIAGALVAGMFIFVIMKQIMNGVVGQIKTLEGFCNSLITRVGTINNDMIKLDTSVSAALDLANVACGRFDGYWQWELSYWDVAAGLVIIKEAGGFVDFLEKDEKALTKKNIIATNSKIHQELKNVLEKKY